MNVYFKLSILTNSSPSKEFSVQRDICQEDPISPFPFDLAIEGLSVLFHI